VSKLLTETPAAAEDSTIQLLPTKDRRHRLESLAAHKRSKLQNTK
jgi:hypothetical protein